jgi:hypothetical protein
MLRVDVNDKIIEQPLSIIIYYYYLFFMIKKTALKIANFFLLRSSVRKDELDVPHSRRHDSIMFLQSSIPLLRRHMIRRTVLYCYDVILL